MMSVYAIASAFIALSVLATPVQGGSVCSLCYNNGFPKWAYSAVDRAGTTCIDLMLNMASLSGSSCSNKQNTYRAMCCTASSAPRVVVSPTPAPVYRGPVGNFPYCPICQNGKPPTKISVIAVEYIGTYSCAQLDAMGKHGAILFNMCYPMQLFAANPCGCGQYARKPTAPTKATVTVTHPQTSRSNGGRKLASPDQGSTENAVQESNEKAGDE